MGTTKKRKKHQNKKELKLTIQLRAFSLSKNNFTLPLFDLIKKKIGKAKSKELLIKYLKL